MHACRPEHSNASLGACHPVLRLASTLGQHGQSVAELCDLCGASCSSSSLVRLLQYYSGSAQLRDALVADWTPLGT